MKILVRLLIGVAAAVCVLLAVSFFLPDHAHVERRVSIAAAPSTIFPLVNNYRNTEQWSPWLARDPETAVTYSGPESGVGASMSWRSDDPEVGSGSQEIIASETDRHVRVALSFEGHGAATAYFELTPEGDSTVLVWGFDTELGANPVMRYMGLMFDGLLGPDYESGLANIKRIVEGG